MTSPSDQFGDFLAQLPTGLFVTVCISGLALFGAFAWFVYFKPQLKRRRLRASITGIGGSVNKDLPDIMSLLDNIADEPAENQPVSAPSPSSTYNIELQNGETTKARQIVSILRDSRDERLIVHMDDTGYRTLANAPEVKKQFVKIMQELSTIITDPDDELEASVGRSRQLAEPQPDTIKSKRTAPPPPINSDGSMPGDLPTYHLEDSLIPRSDGKLETAPILEFDIAESIEAYLQHKLNHLSEYNNRKIHIHSAPGGGVRIQVDDSYFDSVKDITDPEIREFLTGTIEEWQERQ